MTVNIIQTNSKRGRRMFVKLEHDEHGMLLLGRTAAVDWGGAVQIWGVALNPGAPSPSGGAGDQPTERRSSQPSTERRSRSYGSRAARTTPSPTSRRQEE